MKCQDCPVSSGVCLGESVTRLCFLARTRDDYRRLLIDRARGLSADPGARTIPLPEVLALVASCADRGPVLPVSLQPECGCSEVRECRAGRGSIPGQVRLVDCLACMTQAALRSDSETEQPGL